jgi:hypothetical protein
VDDWQGLREQLRSPTEAAGEQDRVDNLELIELNALGESDGSWTDDRKRAIAIRCLAADLALRFGTAMLTACLTGRAGFLAQGLSA